MANMTNTFFSDKISPQQLFCLLLLSRISAEIIYPVSTESIGGEAMTALLIAELIRFLLTLPVIIFSFRTKRDTPEFYGAAYSKNKFLGWIITVFAALLLIAAGARTLLAVTSFAGRSLLPKFSAIIICIIAAAFSVYAAFMGAEAIARAGVLFLVAAAVITAAVMLADIPYMRFGEIKAEYGGLVSDVINRLFGGGDYLIFAALLPFVGGKKHAAGKSALFFALFSALSGVVLCGFFTLTLREFYGLSEYPFTAAASLSDIALFKRLDGAGSAIWALCAVLRAGIMFFSAWSVIMELVRALKGESVAKEGEGA